MRPLLIAIVLTASACIVQPQQQGYQQPAYQQQTPPGAAQPMPPAGPRNLSFNGHPATEQDLQILAQLEASWGARLPDGAYWYDNVSGAAGPWGGPAGGIIQAGLGLGGDLPASASGGGDGNLTGVFINGRELAQADVYAMQSMGLQVYQGYWFVDAYGNFGQEGGPVLGNLVQIVQQMRAQNGGSGGGGDSYYDKDQNGSVFVGGGCVSVSTDSGSYYGSGC